MLGHFVSGYIRLDKVRSVVSCRARLGKVVTNYVR
jgi:hypothetical protein